MNAAIFCSGPSIYADNGAKFDLKIGVNRGSVLRPTDVWVCLDVAQQGRGDPPGGVRGWAPNVIGSPTLITRRDNKIQWRGEVVRVEDWWKPYAPHRLSWTLFSSTTAIAYAIHLGAKEIDIYGMDLAGMTDIDGVNPSAVRSETQWDTQRGLLAKLSEFFSDIRITRHGLA